MGDREKDSQTDRQTESQRERIWQFGCDCPWLKTALWTTGDTTSSNNPKLADLRARSDTHDKIHSLLALRAL